MIYNFDSVVEKCAQKPKRTSFNAQLIPNKLKELALAGTYYDSRML